MFWTVPLSIIRSFLPDTQQWYMPYGFPGSLEAGSGWNQLTYTIAVCTVKNSTVQNMWSFILKIN